MIIGIGMDVVEIDRFARALERHSRRARTRFFTKAEREYCDIHPNSIPSYSVRFAAKEAFAKALGSGIAQGIMWTDVEVIRADSGQPAIVLHNRAKALFEERGGKKIWVTLTHSRNIASAVVVIEA